MYRGCGSQPGALCFLMHFQWLREHCFNKASSQRALPRGFGWRGSEAANELEPIEGCGIRRVNCQPEHRQEMGANSPGRNWTHHFPLMKTRFTPATIIPLFLHAAPALREALLLFLLKQQQQQRAVHTSSAELICLIICFSFWIRKK